MHLCDLRARVLTGPMASVIRILIAIALIVQLAPLPLASGRANNQANDPAQEAIYLSSLEANGDTDGLYSRLHPDAKKVVSRKVIAGWYNAEFFPLSPQPISEIISVNFVSWTWDVTGTTYHQTAEVTYIQPFGTGSSQYQVTETVRLVPYGNGNWGWFFGRSRDFVNEQIRIYDSGPSASAEPTKAVTRTNRTSSSRSSNTGSNNRQSRSTTPQGSTQNCTLVELAPGYPGYRGLVTGISQGWGGLGDWACVETLERDFPQFDQAREDQENLRAAKELKISGDPSMWIWENWMAIEAHRGLPVQCYSCLIGATNVPPINTNVYLNPTDPRLNVGFLGQNSVIRKYLPSVDMHDEFTDDYQMRVYAFLVAGPNSNALDLIDVFETMYDSYNWYFFDFTFTFNRLYRYGGYTYVTEAAYSQDQEFVMVASVLTVTYLHPAPVRNSILMNLESHIFDWQSLGRPGRLSDYLSKELGIP